MQKKIKKIQTYIETYITGVKWLRSLLIPALIALVGFNFFEIKTFQMIGEITKKVEDGESKTKAFAWFVFFFLFGYVLCLLYEVFYAYFVSVSIRSAFTNFFSEFLKIDYKSFHSFGIGEAQFAINRRVYALIEFLSTVCIDFFSNILFFLIAFGSLGHQIKNAKLKFIIMFTIVGFFLFSIVLQYIRSFARYKLNTGYEISSRKMYDILYNYERIVAYNNLETELKKYKKAMNEQIFWGIVFWVSFELIALMNTLFFLGINIYMLGTLGTSKIESLDLKAFMLVFNKAKEEAIGMIESIDLISTNFVNLDQNITEYCPQDENTNAVDIPLNNIEIIAEGISFAYAEHEKPILKNLSVNIQPGEKIAITGINGSGKSTFTKILLGLYDYSGSLKIDGIEYKNIIKKRIRSAITYVPQSAYLFDTSIIENLKISNKLISDEKVIEYCKLYKTHELFKKIGYNKRVGENGKFLSGGQRQKICFMRAAIRCSGALVLDEATSNMDEQSEYQIIQLIKDHMYSKTVVMIIHNLSLLDQFDKIIFFGENYKVEQGKFKELMNEDSSEFSKFYRKTVAQQNIN